MFGAFGANSATSTCPPVSLSERSDSLRSAAVCGRVAVGNGVAPGDGVAVGEGVAVGDETVCPLAAVTQATMKTTVKSAMTKLSR